MAMLVLARRVGEAIVIDGDIVITVVGLKGNAVRLGVTAPRNVSVDRAEVHQRRAELAGGQEVPEPRLGSPAFRGSAGDASPG
jgi:carbon storage regulator